ncbi:MAG: CBS domain-containing protein, partial [Phycisphaerae bacterium]|nr:CBS domain-containing protein [Phycisphaerae bacterium]
KEDARSVLEMMKALNFRQCPVVEENQLIGIITQADLTSALA